MLLGQLWEKQGIGDPIPVYTYLFECPLSRLHGSKIQNLLLYKMKRRFIRWKEPLFLRIIGWLLEEKEFTQMNWDMDMRHEHETWDMDMRHGPETWDMDLRHEKWAWDMDTKLKVQATFLTCTSFSHLHYMHQFSKIMHNEMSVALPCTETRWIDKRLIDWLKCQSPCLIPLFTPVYPLPLNGF